MEYNDKKVLDNLKYLDKILELNLEESNNYTISINDLVTGINPFNFDKLVSSSFIEKIVDYFGKTKSLADLDFGTPEKFTSAESKLLNALAYLQKEELLIFSPNSKISILTFKGIIKLSKGGFYQEYKRNRREGFYRKYFWIVAILTFITGFIIKPLFELLRIPELIKMLF